MAAGIAVDAGESVEQVAAGAELLDHPIPVSLPRAVGMLEALAIDALELVVVLVDELIERRRLRVARAVECRSGVHGESCMQSRCRERAVSGKCMRGRAIPRARGERSGGTEAGVSGNGRPHTDRGGSAEMPREGFSATDKVADSRGNGLSVVIGLPDPQDEEKLVLAERGCE